MAELATRDGGPPPADLPRGECICTRLDDGTVRIDHADPRILISSELLDLLPACPTPQSYAWLNTAGCKPGHGYVGTVLHIDGVNRQVVYRITDMVPRINGYIGEWPDLPWPPMAGLSAKPAPSSSAPGCPSTRNGCGASSATCPASSP